MDLFPVKADFVEAYPLDKLPKDYLTFPPSKEMVDSVRKFGVLEPIILNGTRLVAGRRRIDAARLAELKTIPALVFPAGWADVAVLALVENTQRRSNPVNELHQIEKLIAKGMTYDSIREQTGIKKQTFDRLMMIRDKLISPLQKALRDQLIAVRVAEACAKKSPRVQRQLLDLLEEEGRLTLPDVQRASKVEKREAVAALPATLFGDVGTSWKARVRELVKEAKEIANKQGEAALTGRLDEVLRQV